MPGERSVYERHQLPLKLQRTQIPITKPGFLDDWMAMRRITLAQGRHFLTVDLNTATAAFLVGLIEMCIFLFTQIIGLPSEASNSFAIAAGNQSIVQNATFNAASPVFAGEILGAHGFFWEAGSLIMLLPFIYNAMRFNETIFEEWASLLAAKKALLEPGHGNSNLTNKLYFAEAGGDLEINERRALARRIEAMQDAVLHPMDAHDAASAFGVPLTPRVVLSAFIALLSTAGTTAFRFLYS